MEILYETSTGKPFLHKRSLVLFWTGNRNSLEAYNLLISSGRAKVLTANPTAEELTLLDEGEAVIVNDRIVQDPNVPVTSGLRDAAETVARQWPVGDRRAIEQGLLDRALHASIRSVV